MDLKVTYCYIPPDYVLVYKENITENVKIEHQLIESEFRYRTLTEGLSQTGIGINIVDLSFNVIYQNQFLKDTFGELQERNCFEYYFQHY